VAAAPPRAVGDELALKLGEAAEDVDHEVLRRAGLGWQLAENDLYTFALQVALNYAQMGDIAGQAVNVVKQHRIKGRFGRIVAQSVEFGPRQQSAAKAVVLVDSGYLPNPIARKSLQFGNLGVNGLAFFLLVAGNAGVNGHAQQA
jgi:hypothetical protein